MKLADFKKKYIYGGTQVLLQFGDECKLSVISHSGSYGGKKGLYEIATYMGNFQVELPGITWEGATVKGFLTESEVDVIIKKMTSMIGFEPKQV